CSFERSLPCRPSVLKLERICFLFAVYVPLPSKKPLCAHCIQSVLPCGLTIGAYPSNSNCSTECLRAHAVHEGSLRQPSSLQHSKCKVYNSQALPLSLSRPTALNIWRWLLQFCRHATMYGARDLEIVIITGFRVVIEETPSTAEGRSLEDLAIPKPPIYTICSKTRSPP